MKKLLLFILCGGIVLVSFKDSIDKTAARAEQVHGCAVFLYSDPVNAFDVIGTIKKSGVLKNMSGEQADGVISDLCEKALKDYPTADGILVKGKDLNHADVIKFKEQ